MNLLDFIEALEILSCYARDCDDGQVAAGIDEIWVPCVNFNDLPKHSQDGQRLLELGWEMDLQSECWSCAVR